MNPTNDDICNRWQVKVVAMECALQALRLIQEALVVHKEKLDLPKARQLVEEVGDDGRSAVLTSPQVGSDL